MQVLAFFNNLLQGWDGLILLVLGLLIFGKRLPEVGRSLGRGIVEFKKGLKGISDEVDDASNQPTPRRPDALPRPDAAGQDWSRQQQQQQQPSQQQPPPEETRVSRSDKVD